MLLDLSKEEIKFLKEKFDYSKKQEVPFLEMKIFDKLELAEDTNNMSVDEALDKLYKAYNADSGVSPYIKDFLISLSRYHTVNLSKLCELDGHNFKAVQVLINALKTEDRFKIWERFNEEDFLESVK